MTDFFPRIIWCLWLQGWDSAPDIVQACLKSWKRFNPEWRIHALDEQLLHAFLPHAVMDGITTRQKEREALSDQIRIELLSRYGGVWVDATALCTRPLDDWLPNRMATGFFAFERPVPSRMLASWFLAAEKGSYIIERWRQATVDYWNDRAKRDDYFWFHQLFAKIYSADDEFRTLWDETPKLPAMHAGHFGPNDARLSQRATDSQLQLLSSPPAPVFKLTHKLLPHREPASFIDALCQFGHGPGDAVPTVEPRACLQRRILVAWYGSFAGHGTVGDLRSLECAVTHLVGRGHTVFHATAADYEIPGATKVSWRDTRTDEFDAVVFVCGPILKSHPDTSAFFEHFRSSPLIGVGVSLFDAHHAQHSNPFDIVLARQGNDERFGDLAVAAPSAPRSPSALHEQTVGLVLRGPQSEYGQELCMWRETEALATRIASTAFSGGSGRVITIENHLARSGLSPDQIEDQYRECNLIVTSRFHGAVTALRAGVPFIAIDQIQGGAKVYDLLANLGWPHVYRIDDINEQAACATAKRLLLSRGQHELTRARNRAMRDANRTLFWLDTHVRNARRPATPECPSPSPP
jgi:hypothetical protein